MTESLEINLHNTKLCITYTHVAYIDMKVLIHKEKVDKGTICP